MSEFHSRHGAVATLGLCQVSDPSCCGVAITDHGGVIVDFQEKPEAPRSNWVFSGLMIANPAIFDSIPSQIPADIAFHVLPRLLGKMRAYPITDYLLDIGTIPNYQKAQISWPGNESKSSDQDGSVPSFENRPADSGNFQPISGAEIS